MTLLTRWEPLRELSPVQDRMNRMNRLFRESYSASSTGVLLSCRHPRRRFGMFFAAIVR